MKSEIKRVEKQEQKYPCLKEYVEMGLESFVVLFTAETNGTVVHAGESKLELGERSLSWYSADNGKYWKDFKGEIILKN